MLTLESINQIYNKQLADYQTVSVVKVNTRWCLRQVCITWANSIKNVCFLDKESEPCTLLDSAL